MQNHKIPSDIEINSMDKASCFFNPIVPGGADPWLFKHADGYYYFTKTTGTNIAIWRTTTITGIENGTSQVVWTPPASGSNSKNIWAPELHWLYNKWYIYYAADDGNNENHRMFVLESTSSDPFGPYEDKGQITDPTNKWAIDGTVLHKNDGSLYLIWSGWAGDRNVCQNLYIAPMSNPYTISGNRVEISTPTHSWEKVGKPYVNEGPQILTRNDHLFLIYSASGSWTDDYCLGMLSTKVSNDVLAAASWSKTDVPVFSKANGVYGPGHCSFTTSPDGSEDWIIYHAAKYRGAGWQRNIRTQQFTWNSDDRPNFGSPLSILNPIRKPSGE